VNKEILDINFRGISFKVHSFPFLRFWTDYQIGKWELETFKILDFYIKATSVVIDLGSSFGPLSLYLGKKASKIYAIDPDPIMQEALSKNIKLNPDLEERIVPIEKAITQKTQKYSLSARAEYGTSSSSILKRALDKTSNLLVDGITFEELLNEEKIDLLDFIKIDIEGGEFLILDQIISQLKKLDYPTTYIEFHPDYLKETLLLRKFKSKLFSRFIYKACRILKIDFLDKEVKTTINQILKQFSAYKYIYLGLKKVSIQELEQLPTHRLGSILFSNIKFKA